MPLLRVEAEKLSNNVLVQGVIEEIIDRDALFAMVPFQRIVGKALVYNRENTLSEGDFLDPYDVINEGAASFDEVTAKLRILAGDVDVDNFIDETMGDTNDQTAIQLQSKVKALGRKFRRTLAIGDSSVNTKEFDGLSALTDSNQVLTASANGANLTFEALDELISAVKLGPDALVMRPGTIRAMWSLMRSLGGTHPEHIELPNLTGVQIPTYMGIPILVNEFLPGDETQGTATNSTCSVYAARFNEQDGLHGIYGGPVGGIRVETVGTVQNKDAQRYRVKWYTGTALKSTMSLARLKGIKNV